VGQVSELPVGGVSDSARGRRPRLPADQEVCPTSLPACESQNENHWSSLAVRPERAARRLNVFDQDRPGRLIRRRRFIMRRNIFVVPWLFVFALGLHGQPGLDWGYRDVSQLSARSSPNWLRRASIYQLWLKSFTAEGTLRAAEARLGQIADLGAQIIYLSPINPGPTPFTITDYYGIDPAYGTEEDLKSFVRRAHQLGLKVMMDLVFYHSAPDNVLMADPNNYLRTPAGKIILGYWHLPRLNFQNPKTRRYLIDNMLHWVRDCGADGFRCDVSGGIPLSFWEEARLALDTVKRDVILLAECDMPEEQVRAFDLSYNYPFFYFPLVAVMAGGEPATLIRDKWLEARRRFPRGARFLYFIDNHDQTRPVVLFSQGGAMAGAVLCFTMDGIPFIFCGQEIGSPLPTNFTGDPKLVIDFPKPAPDHPAPPPEIWKQYQRLFAMRRQEPALTEGELIWIDNSQPASVISFLRKKGDDEIVVVVNVSNRRVDGAIDLPWADYRALKNLLAPGQLVTTRIQESKFVFHLPAYGCIVGKRIPPETMAEFPKFQRHVIDHFPAGYQAAVADMNGDGRPDVIALSTEKNRVDWYENPTWKAHPVARTERNIDLAVRDLDGRGKPGIAVASGFYFSDANRGGQIQWLEPPASGAESTNLWRAFPIAADPVVHRLRWGDLDGDGRPELVHAPIFGPGSRETIAPKPSHLWAFRPPADPRTGTWSVWKIDETLTVLHGIHISDLDHDGRDEILTASFEGIHRFDFEGSGQAGHWIKTRLGSGAPPRSDAPGAPRGSSEVAPGKLAGGGRFIAAIEPWHGELVVVYTPPNQPGLWSRHVLDDSMTEGHALVVADLDGDGRDEIIAGWRGKGGGISVFHALDNTGAHWRKEPLDTVIAVECLVAADLNGDGRLDLVANAGRSNLLVWYEQQR
jgi:cyclomaltodextrinase / maltogenic alpha-amylase / neopullulanase